VTGWKYSDSHTPFFWLKTQHETTRTLLTRYTHEKTYRLRDSLANVAPIQQLEESLSPSDTK